MATHLMSLDDEELFRACLRMALQGHFLRSPHLAPTDDDLLQLAAEATRLHHGIREGMARETAEARQQAEAIELFTELSEEDRQDCETNWMLANDIMTLPRLAQLVIGHPALLREPGISLDETD